MSGMENIVQFTHSVYRAYPIGVQSLLTLCTQLTHSVYRAYPHCTELTHTVYRLQSLPTLCTELIHTVYRAYPHCTLSGRIGKVVASHAAVARSSPAEVGLIYTMHVALRGYCSWGWGCDQSIGSTVSDAIVSSWLLLTATRSSPLGCFSTLLQVVDNWTHILW